MGRGKTGQQKAEANRKRLEIENRRKVVAANILAGATYRDIARSLGVSPATIAGDVKAVQAEWREHYVKDTNDWASVQLRRLDVMISAIWEKARNGDKDAIDRVLKIMERQAKLLGLDQPQRIETTFNWESLMRVDPDQHDDPFA